MKFPSTAYRRLLAGVADYPAHFYFSRSSTWLSPSPFSRSACRLSVRQWSSSVALRQLTSQRKKGHVAVLFQAIKPPIIKCVRKPMKPGGYQDSGADIAFSLQSDKSIDVITPHSLPEPRTASGWCFPDTEEGIVDAIERGATHLWVNTILFACHPLQSSKMIGKYQDDVRIIGQPPLLVEQFDDKELVNDLLRAKGNFSLPRGWSLTDSEDLPGQIAAMQLPYPILAKPIRGRGSHGVMVCHTPQDLMKHVKGLFKESPSIMLEEYLSGEEATITVMPPSAERREYWSMPVVARFNHIDGIAPYNGVVAVTSNPRVVSLAEMAGDPTYLAIQQECEAVGKVLRVTAPIRIDIRRFSPGSKFALFDVNMKPNMTGPGRPGRKDQASLTALSAAALGWDYPKLLHSILTSSQTLRHLRQIESNL